MKKLNYISIVVVITFLFTGCGVVSQSQVSKGQLYPKLYKEHPKSILVLPAKNTTTSVDATDHFRYTITRPLAEKGYYVFPIHLVDSFFKSENLSNVEQIRQIPIKKLKEVFNCDSILYIDIHSWDTDYGIVSSKVSTGISYSLVDANTGKELWHLNNFTQSMSDLQNGILVALISAATNSATDYMELSHLGNLIAFNNLPFGIYHDEYQKDGRNNILIQHNGDIMKASLIDLASNSPLGYYDPLYMKDGRLYVNKYFIFGNNKKEKAVLKRPTTVAYPGFSSFNIYSMNILNHNGYKNYYYRIKINQNTYLRNRFFMYEDGNPYLIIENKKVFVFTESDGTIPFSEDSGNYYFNIDRIIELKSSTPNKT